ncbi:MAG TPA: hypothetical protein VJA18_06915 [Candidatus Nanoarchaeia archaeon]|nr:hypothetical protein [Candidatus Nanoarchaeia archaeon]
MMMVSILGSVASLLGLELLLRSWHYRKKIIAYDLQHYPYYRRPRNSYGKDIYYVSRLGKKNTAPIRISSEGIRNDIAGEKRKLILALGCSVTEGASLTEEKTYPGILQKFVDEKEYAVINAGIGGYGIFQIEALLHDLIRYQPKAVMIQLIDFKRIPLKKEKIKKTARILRFSQKLKQTSVLLWHLYKIVYGRRISRVRSPYMMRGLLPEVLWEKNLPYLESIQQLCSSRKIPLIFFIWPSKDPQWMDNSFFQQKIKQFCHKGAHTFDSREMLRFYREEELHLKNDAHPSALANRLVAKAAYECLKKELVV